MSFWHLFKGPSGNPSMGRTLLGLGGANGIVSPTGFELWKCWSHPELFNVTEYSLAISACMVSLSPLLLSIGSQDKGTAVARATLAMPPLSDKTEETK